MAGRAQARPALHRRSVDRVLVVRDLVEVSPVRVRVEHLVVPVVDVRVVEVVPAADRAPVVGVALRAVVDVAVVAERTISSRR